MVLVAVAAAEDPFLVQPRPGQEGLLVEEPVQVVPCAGRAEGGLDLAPVQSSHIETHLRVDGLEDLGARALGVPLHGDHRLAVGFTRAGLVARAARAPQAGKVDGRVLLRRAALLEAHVGMSPSCDDAVGLLHHVDVAVSSQVEGSALPGAAALASDPLACLESKGREIVRRTSAAGHDDGCLLETDDRAARQGLLAHHTAVLQAVVVGGKMVPIAHERLLHHGSGEDAACRCRDRAVVHEQPAESLHALLGLVAGHWRPGMVGVVLVREHRNASPEPIRGWLLTIAVAQKMDVLSDVLDAGDILQHNPDNPGMDAPWRTIDHRHTTGRLQLGAHEEQGLVSITPPSRLQRGDHVVKDILDGDCHPLEATVLRQPVVDCLFHDLTATSSCPATKVAHSNDGSHAQDKEHVEAHPCSLWRLAALLRGDENVTQHMTVHV
mmetsp:Transcript_30871/g.79287  ORF Transcript_30871/g.79287 Transcript_30871/m.79287 type:complete len:438 (-) Transcript_30871:430-1743(-)